MNSNPKLELHPDAESLSAFAEQALGERERGQILAHLAECGRCREVVFVAQEAAAERMPELAFAAAAAPAQESEVTQKKGARGWSWRFAWVPAGALAVLVTAAYVAHVRQVESYAEQARAASEAAARGAEMASAPETGMKAAPLPVAPGPVAHAPEAAAAKVVKSGPRNGAFRQMTAEAAPAPLEVGGVTARSSSDEVALPGRSKEASPAMSVAAQREAEPAVAATQERQGFAAEALQKRRVATGATEAAVAVKPEVHKAAGGMLAATARSAQVDANLDAKRGPAGSGMTNGPPMKDGGFAFGQAKWVGLPSGLPAVSTMSAQGLTLAVDGTGGVFVSEGAGHDWESVAKQWSGRAVAVRLQTAAAGEGASRSASTIFEIVNDQGEIWVSTDGRNWKAK